MNKTPYIFSVILAVLLLIFVLSSEPEKKLGALETKIASLRSEQNTFLSTDGKYKHIPWTKDGDIEYRVDEWQKADGTSGYEILTRTLETITSATGSQQTFYAYVKY